MSKHRSSKTLMQGCRWLQKDDVRNAAIFEVVERNSIIEGLPRLSQALRQRLDRQYRTLNEQSPKQL